jgi:hypothetical protein
MVFKKLKIQKSNIGQNRVIPFYYHGYTVVGRGEIKVKYFILVNWNIKTKIIFDKL